MGSPTFRLERVIGLHAELDPWGIFSDGGMPSAGLPLNRVFSDRRLRLNFVEGDLHEASFHYHRVARARALREAIVRIALEEWNYWQLEHGRGGLPTEDDGQEGSKKVQQYWKVVGMNYRTKAELSNHPWSAAFISYVMKQAGAFPDFTLAQKHTTYFYHAKEARRDRYGSLFKAYPASGSAAVRPEIGDLIANARGGSPVSYDKLEPSGISHSDIVVEKKGGAIVVVGGNVSAGQGKGNKVVGKKYIALNSSGYLESAKYLRPDGTMSTDAPVYWAVMKIEERTASLLRPGAKR